MAENPESLMHQASGGTTSEDEKQPRTSPLTMRELVEVVAFVAYLGSAVVVTISIVKLTHSGWAGGLFVGSFIMVNVFLAMLGATNNGDKT